MVDLPLGHAVEVERGGDGVDPLCVGSHNVNIVERTVEDPVERRIMRHDLDCLCLCGVGNREGAGRGSAVARLVADDKLNDVLSLCKIIGGSSDDAVSISGSNGIAVDQNLNGGFIQTGVVALGGVFRYSCGEVKSAVAVGYIAVCQGHALVGVRTLIAEDDLREYGSFSILYDGGIVNGHIVHIYGEVAVDVVLILCVVTVGRAVTVGDIELHAVVEISPGKALVCAEISSQIMPAGLVKAVHHAGAACAAVHRVGVEAGERVGLFACLCIFVDRRDGADRPADPKADILVGNIEPCAQGERAFIIVYIAAGLALVHSDHLIA